MSKQAIINYVMKTPHNTNRMVLESMMKELGTGGSGDSEELIKLLSGSSTEITIPDEVKTIREGAFVKCYDLSKIKVSDNHPTYLVVGDILYNKDQDTIIAAPPGKMIGKTIVPESVVNINDFAFASCKNLEQVELSPNVKFIGENAFYDCADNFEALFALDGQILNQGGPYLSETNKTITGIIIPDNAEYVAVDAFNCFPNLNTVYVNGQCDWEKYTVTINKNLYTKNVFTANNMEIQKLVIDGDSSVVEEEFMYDMISLKQVDLGDNITDIGQKAFYGCVNLSNIDIPKGVKNIGDNAFYECAQIEPDIPDSIVSVGAQAFSYTGIKKVTILPNVFYGDSAFSHCQELSEVIIQPGVTSLSQSLFSNCGLLKEIIIPGSVDKIPGSIFSYCENLEQVEIEEGPIGIGQMSFFYCPNLKEVILPNTITYIDEYAFFQCSSLKEIFIPESVTQIATFAFTNDSDLTIRGYSGSYAETYANQFSSITFVPIEE